MIVALLVSASISAMADDSVNRVNGVAVSPSNPNVATPMEGHAEQPTPVPLTASGAATTPAVNVYNWFLVSLSNGPGIPPGWQLVNIEAVQVNGTSTNRWNVYIYNPTTRATVSWVIGMH